MWPPLKPVDPSLPQRFVIEDAEVGLRLQQILVRRYGLSLSQASRLLDRGLVQVDHWIAKRKHKGYKLTAGQSVKVASFTPHEKQSAIINEELALEILAADEERGWVIVNKPAGVPVHPLKEEETQTVLSALIAKYPQMQGVGEGGLRSGVVHRLDVETSGTLLFATRQDTWTRLRKAFTEHRTTKRYHALVLGQLEGEREEKMLLNIARHRPATVRIVDETQPESDWPAGSRWCDLRWKSVQVFAKSTLIEVELGTGFLHQIRIMFSQLGHPLVGERHYARQDVPDHTEAARPMLHACELIAEEAKAICDLPADMKAIIAREG